MINIDRSIKLGELLQADRLFEVFVSHGFSFASKEDLMDALGKDTMLQTVLKVRNINAELFMEALNEKLEGEILKGDFNERYYDNDKTLNFLGGVICPLRAAFKDKFEDMLEEHRKQTGKRYNCYIPSGHMDDEYDKMWAEEDIDKFPDIVLFKGMDDLYRKDLKERFIDRGYFKSVNSCDLEEGILEADCLDENYTMYGAFLDVLVIDEERLGDLPEPKTWGDLLNPGYMDKIITFETPDGISTAIPHMLYKEYGEKSIGQFALNVKGTYHGAQMAKLVGMNSPDAGAIYTMPLIFARSCLRPGLKLVIPEDGALMYPLVMLVKKDKAEELKPITDFMLEVHGSDLVRSCGVSMSSEVRNPILQEHKLKWIGWDYVRSNDMVELGEHIRAEFYKVWNDK